MLSIPGDFPGATREEGKQPSKPLQRHGGWARRIVACSRRGESRPTERARLDRAATFTLSPNAADCRREMMMMMHNRTARPAWKALSWRHCLSAVAPPSDHGIVSVYASMAGTFARYSQETFLQYSYTYLPFIDLHLSMGISQTVFDTTFAPSHPPRNTLTW